jgi:predicted metal-dependent enzyme (double-stranded beta helix superfamily)
MTQSTYIPCVATFIAEMRALFARDLTDAARWARAQQLLQDLVRDPELLRHSATWPDSPALLGLEGKHGNLLFYEDPDHKFVINGLIKKPTAKTTVHDHGLSWTLYGVVDGGEDVLRFTRTDGGAPGDLPTRATVAETGKVGVGPGYVDLIKPWEIHAEYNRPTRTVAVIVRSQRSGTYVQNIFYPATGTVEQYWGPRQIPFSLSWPSAA